MPRTQAIKFDDGWRTDPVYAISLDPCPKRVRVVFGGETVADSTRVLTLLEQNHTPVYYFPEGDVRMDLMTPTDHTTHCPHKGDASYWTLAVPGHKAENAVWGYRDPAPHMAGIKGHVAFYWDRMDRWLEEDEEVFVHPRDPRKRIDIIASDRTVEVVLGGETVAKSNDAEFLFETDLPTRYYLPEDDVQMELLTQTDLTTQCPYKGEAVYWTAEVGGQRFENIVWSYPEPVEESPRLAGRLCFLNEAVDAILVDGEEMPRPKTKWSRD